MTHSTPRSTLSPATPTKNADTRAQLQPTSRPPDATALSNLHNESDPCKSIANHLNPAFTQRQALALLLWLSPTITPKRWHDTMAYLAHAEIDSIESLHQNRTCFEHIVDNLTPRNTSATKQTKNKQQKGKSTTSPSAIANSLRQTQRIDYCLSWLARTPASAIYFPFDAHYPKLLRQLSYPPILFLHGDTSLLDRPQIAIVGSRNASHTALAFAQTIAQSLGTSGVTITSGLAYGIDTQAHLGALTTLGSTIAVLGQGIDIIYPKSNAALYQRMISEGGLLVSEFALGTSPLPRHFPQRNRIISGLSLGTLIVEAALKSGSLITARTAMEQNREVFAVPGSIKNPLSKGCHLLIKQGAALVESPDDILDVIAHRLSEYIEKPSKHVQSNDTAIQKPSTTPITNDLFSEIGDTSNRAVDEQHITTQRKSLQTQSWNIEAPSTNTESTHTSAPDKIVGLGNVTDALSNQILNALDFDQPKSLDAIAAACNISMAHLHSAITQMVLFGAIHEVSTGLFVRSA